MERGARRSASETFTGSEDTLLAMVAHTRDALVVVEVAHDRGDARVAAANPAFFELSGYSPDAVIGYSPALLQAAETDRAELQRLAQAARRGESARGLVLLRRADGRRRWVEVDVVPLDGVESSRVLGVARDVSERVRSERLQTLTARWANDLVAVTDGEGRFHCFEPRRRPVLGHDPDELLGRDVFHLLHADDAEELRRALANPADAGPLVVRLRHADGSWRRFELHVRDHRGDGRIAGLVLAGPDVSVREHARAELARSTEQLRMAAEVAGLGIWHLDLDQEVLTQDALASEPFAIDPDGPPMSLEHGLAHVHAEDREALREAIRRAVDERQALEQTFRVVRSTGAWRWLVARGQVACSPDGTPTHVNGVTLDVTERHEQDPAPVTAERERLVTAERTARRAASSARAALAHATTHDSLTGLINRAELERRMGLLLADPSPPVAVLFVDVDDFRAVNSSLGHAIGDAVLGHVAGRLTHRCRPPALVGRFGGDKFVVVLTGAELDEALAVAHRLRGALHEPYEAQGRTVMLSASVGVAVAADGDSVDTVIRNADTAVASAKRGGRGRVAVYDDSLHQQALQRLDTESELRATRHGEELELHHQPIFALTGGRRIGAEALMRWRHPRRGLLHPSAFIDIAEDTGLIVPMGVWVIERACRAIADRRATDAVGTLWVNAAAPQLLSSDLAATVAEAQQRHGIRAGELGIELTERTLLTERDAVAAQLQRLHELGVLIAIDDFGTGYSSMSLLQQYPLDVLKIDRAFVARLHTSDGDAIVRAVVQLAHALDAAASAEGVETQLQLQAVRDTGCDSAGGFLLARPQPEDESLPSQVSC